VTKEKEKRNKKGAKKTRRNKAQCSGDSGGPLVFEHPTEEEEYVIEGIASWGAFYNRSCAFTNRPDVFARISHYKEWIEEIAFPAKEK